MTIPAGRPRRIGGKYGALLAGSYRARARWRCGALTTVVVLLLESRTFTLPRTTCVSVPSQRSVVFQRALVAVAVL